MSARKFLYVAPVLALLTAGSTVWAVTDYSCYVDQNTSPVGFKTIGTNSRCIDYAHSNMLMFTTGVHYGTAAGSQYLNIGGGSNANLPSNLKFQAFGFDQYRSEICTMVGTQYNILGVARGSFVTSDRCILNGNPSTPAQNGINTLTFANVYSYGHNYGNP